MSETQSDIVERLKRSIRELERLTRSSDAVLNGSRSVVAGVQLQPYRSPRERSQIRPLAIKAAPAEALFTRSPRRPGRAATVGP
jgi:hypothetical protein